MKKNWYEYNVRERFENVYSKFSIKDFWNWWSDGKDEYMEIRIRDFKLIKEYSKKYHVPMSSSGLYINEAWKLEKIINHFSKKCVMWFAVNPKRKLRNKFGYMSFSGLDINVSKIKFLFIDIDRIIKEGLANTNDLMMCDLLVNALVNELSNVGFDKNHCKICSGNGLQLLIKLDVPIEIPMPVYNEIREEYIEDSMFDDSKNIIMRGIGPILKKFSASFKDKYNVEIDSSCFNMGRVAALPYSFNFKHNSSIPRGIIELENSGVNKGLSDYLRDVYVNKKTKTRIKKSLSDKTEIILTKEYEIKYNELQKNKIIDLMMTHTFPNGGINNTLWYGIKLLLHSNGIDNSYNEYRDLHFQLKKIHKRSFSQNGLEPKYNKNFDGPFKANHIVMVPSMINKYLRLNKIKNIKTSNIGYHRPLFPISPRGKKREELLINITPKIFSLKKVRDYSLNKDKDDPLEDIYQISKDCYRKRRGYNLPEFYKISEYELSDIGKTIVSSKINDLFIAFMHSFREKWGDEITIYMMKYYMNDYLNYKRY